MNAVESATSVNFMFFMFEFPCIITLYYIKNQQDATLAVLFISNRKITVRVSDSFCVHPQEYLKTVVAATGACRGSG
jgi:hypothetical protein